MGERASPAARAAEHAARVAYGRLIASLVAQTGDLARAEDALAEAFAAALAGRARVFPMRLRPGC